MDSEESKIIRLFSDLADTGKSRGRRYVKTAVVVLFVTVALLVFRLYLGHELKAQEAAMEGLQEDVMLRDDIIREMQEEMERRERARIHADKLRLEGIRVSNMNGDLVARGTIRNTGTLGIDDIVLTAYGLDDKMDVVFEREFVASSPDGKPLGRGQKRRFRVRLDGAPAGTREIVLIITDMELEPAQESP